MNENNLKEMILEYIGTLDNTHKEEWYFTDRRMHYIVLSRFMKETFGIELGD